MITITAPITYVRVIKGTNLAVTLAMPLMPPIITDPTTAARKAPNNHPLSEKKLASPPEIK